MESGKKNLYGVLITVSLHDVLKETFINRRIFPIEFQVNLLTIIIFASPKVECQNHLKMSCLFL